MKKIIIKLCLSILMLSSLTGCGDYQELNKMSLVVAIGIDKTNDEKQPYTVTFQIVNPSEVAGGAVTASTGKALSVIDAKVKGENIVDALRNVSKSVPRPLFLGHTSLIVLNEAAAKDGIYKVLDVFERNSKASSDTAVIVARGASANKILGTVSPLEKISGLARLGNVKNGQQISGEVFPTEIYEIIESLAVRGREATLAGIYLPKKDEKLTTQENTLRANAITPPIKGVGLFRDGKLVGWLDGKGGLAAGLALKKAKSTYLSVPCGDGSFSLDLTKINGEVDTTWNNGKPILTLNVNARGTIYEVTCEASFQTNEDGLRLAREAEAELEKQLKNGIIQAQKKESDIFGFGENLRNEDPKKWKEVKEYWPAYFGKAEVRVKANIGIARTNMRSEPLHPIHGKGEND